MPPMLALNSSFLPPAVTAPKQRALGLYDFYNATFESIIADTDALREECFKLRYEVYCVEYDWLRYENKFMAQEIERDIYDDHSVHALLRHRATGMFIGTVRLILHPHGATTGAFPIHQLCRANNLTIPEIAPLQHQAEISRFCIGKKFRRRVLDTIQGIDGSAKGVAEDCARVIPAMSLGLISALYQMARQNNVQQWCAEMEPSLIERLTKLGIYFENVGPLIEFHGQRQICHKPLDAWIARIKQEQPEIWDIITNKGQHCVPLRLH